MSGKDTAPTYPLGHSEAELDRLVTQSRFYGELSEEVLVRAGIRAGMRVLDLGCGAGDVSLLLASMVGPTGSVLGVDRSAESVKFAQERAARAGFGSVTFAESDLTDFMLDAPIDAIVGRFVLLYLADPASVLTRLRPFLRPGGLVVFHEMDMTTARSCPTVPLYQRAMHWIEETFRRGGAQVDMGSRLFATFRKAGLPGPELLLRARIEVPPDSPAYAYIAESVRSVLPMAESLGVTTAAEVQVDTLADRLRDEVVKAQAVLVLPSVIGAWVGIPEMGVNTANPAVNPTPVWH